MKKQTGCDFAGDETTNGRVLLVLVEMLNATYLFALKCCWLYRFRGTFCVCNKKTFDVAYRQRVCAQYLDVQMWIIFHASIKHRWQLFVAAVQIYFWTMKDNRRNAGCGNCFVRPIGGTVFEVKSTVKTAPLLFDRRRTLPLSHKLNLGLMQVNSCTCT